MKAKTAETNDRLGELIVVLDRLAGLYRDLAAIARRKLGHMARADSEALNMGVALEEELTRTARAQEGLRGQLMELVGRGYGMAPQSARGMSATQLLERAPATCRLDLERSVRRLREAALELMEANRVARLVAQEVLTHLRHVFAAIGAGSESAEVYSPHGRVPEGGSRRIFETLG